MLYASWAKGYKVGNVEGARSSDPATAGHWLGPEIATTWEAGIKADTLDHRLQANFDAFSSLNAGRTDLISPSRVASATVKSKGIEAEATFAVSPNLRLHGGLGLLSARYRKLSANHPVLQPNPGFRPAIQRILRCPRAIPFQPMSITAPHWRGAGQSSAMRRCWP